MPGHGKTSWGYHGDGAGFAEGYYIIEWPKFSEGDVVGCGVDWDKDSMFFSRNGKKLGKSHLHLKMSHVLTFFSCRARYEYTQVPVVSCAQYQSRV